MTRAAGESMRRLRSCHPSRFHAFPLALVLAGCSLGTAADDASDPGDETGGDQTDGSGSSSCLVLQYGDGVCQLDLPCAEPDIDCFMTFDSQVDAEEFFLSFEELLAAEENRSPRALVPSSDPRFGRMATLLAQGWLAYQTLNQVGDLIWSTPALVLVEDPTVNAFVIPDVDTGLAGLAVMVHTGTLDQDASDEALLGLVMHELEHVIGLHVVGDTVDRLRTFYVAGDAEPLGFLQGDDPVAREHGSLWRVFAEEIGPFDQPELSGLPLGGNDQLSDIFFAVLGEVVEDPACFGPIDDYIALRDEIIATFSGFTVDLDITDRTVRRRADDVMDALRDECLPDFATSFVEVLADLVGITPEDVRDQLLPEDLALVEDVHFIDAVRQVEVDRRARMRAVEDSFTEATGRPFSSLRYFSFEEAADDATVPVLDDIGLSATGLGEFLFLAMDPDTHEACAEALEEGEFPPYGADLGDEHHATCWRVAHNGQLFASGAVTGGSDRPPTSSSIAARLRRRAPEQSAARLPKLPPRLSDLVIH